MKANFPVEYMTAVMTADAGDVDTIAVMVAECKRMGIPILPPDVNESMGDFAVILGARLQALGSSGNSSGSSDEGGCERGDTSISADFSAEKSAYPSSVSAAAVPQDAIRFGLYSIKNFGRAIADAIIAERSTNGPFTSISDFLRRITHDNLNKKGLEALIQSGALDSLALASDTERGQLMANIDRLLEYRREHLADAGQDSLFSMLGGAVADVQLMPAGPASMAERLAWEKELLGLYISGHPLDQFREKLARRPMTLAQLREQLQPGMPTIAAGIIEDIRVILTRSGDQMAFIRLADFDSSIEAVVFPKSYAEHKAILAPQRCIALKGRLSNRNGELSLVTEALKEL
jgi:DNA polymerase-3 subunit alpha